MTYSEKLRDPRWQEKRLRIMERDGFCCFKCFSKDNTLNVHHKKYISGKEPWDYPNWYLVTLCEKCHKEEHGQTKEEYGGHIKYSLEILKSRGFPEGAIARAMTPRYVDFARDVPEEYLPYFSKTEVMEKAKEYARNIRMMGNKLPNVK